MPPPVAVSISISGKRETIAAFNALRLIAHESLAKCIKASSLNIQRGAKRKTPVDTGALRANIRPIFDPNGLGASVFTDLQYAPFIEFGTGPHGAKTNKRDLPPGFKHSSKHSPSSSSLENWVRRKFSKSLKGRGDQRDKQIKAIAYLVARKIRLRGGLPARPFLGPAFDEEIPNFKKCIETGVVQSIKKTSVPGAGK